MTSPTEVKSMDAITTLLAERQRYEAWIATLEARRDSTPAHVYTRVRADYEKRLIAVLDQLNGRSGELESAVSGLSARVSELLESENVKRDERAEAELRAAVGEYSADQWEEMSRRVDEELKRLESQRNEAGGELSQVQELLLQATKKSDAITPPTSSPAVSAPAPSAAGSPAAPPAGPRSVPDFVPPPPMRFGGAGTRGEPSAPQAGASVARSSSPDFDELAFLKSVVGPRDAAGGGGAPARAPLTNPAPEPSSADAGGYGAARASASAPAAPPASSARQPSPPSQPSQPASDFPAADTRDRLSQSVPAFLKDVPSEQVKTLKCQECGTMNYPTEWYCERCGGELAAM